MAQIDAELAYSSVCIAEQPRFELRIDPCARNDAIAVLGTRVQKEVFDNELSVSVKLFQATLK